MEEQKRWETRREERRVTTTGVAAVVGTTRCTSERGGWCSMRSCRRPSAPFLRGTPAGPGAARSPSPCCPQPCPFLGGAEGRGAGTWRGHAVSGTPCPTGEHSRGWQRCSSWGQVPAPRDRRPRLWVKGGGGEMGGEEECLPDRFFPMGSLKKRRKSVSRGMGTAGLLATGKNHAGKHSRAGLDGAADLPHTT